MSVIAVALGILAFVVLYAEHDRWDTWMMEEDLRSAEAWGEHLCRLYEERGWV